MLAPYRGQVALIERLLRKISHHMDVANVVVSSVDGYQGREADVIIFTAVRSNGEGKLGFLNDARRLNVAITRAKRWVRRYRFLQKGMKQNHLHLFQTSS